MPNNSIILPIRGDLQPPDPDFSSVVYLMHFDGADGGTTFEDVRGNPVTPVGTPKLSTAKVKFGSTALSLNGSSHIALATPGVAAMPFTFEAWFNPDAVGPNLNYFGQSSGPGTVPKMLLYLDGNQRFRFDCGSLGNITTNVTPNPNEQMHIAVVRESTAANKTKLYLNGLLAGTGTVTDATALAASFNIGYVGEAYGTKFVGAVDELRLSVNKARYLDNFTPPEFAFSNY